MKRVIYAMAGLLFKLFPHRPIVTAQLQRILVIRLCCIGDILFTTPVLRALGKNFPRAQISYMVCGWCKELAAADPRVSATIEFNAYDQVGFWQKLKRAIRAVADIRHGRFDAAIILHRSPMAGILAAAAGVPVRVGFDWQGEGFAHTHRVPFRYREHEIDRNLDCLRPLNASVCGSETELTVPEEQQVAAEKFLQEQGYRPEAGPLIAIFPAGGINPGTTMVTKRWPLEGYFRVCQSLMQEQQAQLIFIGNQADQGVVDEIIGQGEWPSPPIRAEGKTSLLLLAALLERCALFIGGDSGPLHIAAAVKTPTLSIFGPTDPQLLAPRGEQHRVIRSALACSPCYNPITVRQNDVTVCREKTHLCMQRITPAMVLEQAVELLTWKGSERK